MPSAKSVPAGWVVCVSRSSASRAVPASPACMAASTSSGSAHTDTQYSKVFNVAWRAGHAASW